MINKSINSHKKEVDPDTQSALLWLHNRRNLDLDKMTNNLLNQTASYEPPPAWNCNHDWRMIGAPYRFFVADNTAQTTAPINTPLHQKVHCLLCGGFAVWVLPLPAINKF